MTKKKCNWINIELKIARVRMSQIRTKAFKSKRLDLIGGIK